MAGSYLAYSRSGLSMSRSRAVAPILRWPLVLTSSPERKRPHSSQVGHFTWPKISRTLGSSSHTNLALLGRCGSTSRLLLSTPNSPKLPKVKGYRPCRAMRRHWDGKPPASLHQKGEGNSHVTDPPLNIMSHHSNETVACRAKYLVLGQGLNEYQGLVYYKCLMSCNGESPPVRVTTDSQDSHFRSSSSSKQAASYLR